MNLATQLSLCAIAWTLTLARLVATQWKNVSQNNGIALRVSLMMLFFSITTIFLIKQFCDLFDFYTINNLDRLIAYCSILTGMFFGTMASVDSVGEMSDKRIHVWLEVSLSVVIITLVVLYARYVSRIPVMDYVVPRSLPEVWFMLTTFLYGSCLCIAVGWIYAAYLPVETSPIMRARATLIIAGAALACAYFLVKIAIVMGYLWPFLASSLLIDLSSKLLILAALTHLSAMLDNRMYARHIMIFRSVKNWSTFQDLKYMMWRLLRLCPGTPALAPNPPFWKFVFSPEYFLYSAIITILDSKTILDDLLSEGALHGEPPLWEGNLLREVAEVRHALQGMNAASEFRELVHEYARVGKGLLQNQNQGLGSLRNDIG